MKHLLILFFTLLLLSSCRFGADNDPQQVSPVDNSETIVFEEPDTVKETQIKISPLRADNWQPAKGKKPKVAIIIDDMGFHHKVGLQLLTLDLDISFSFLPHAPFTRELQDKAYQLGRDIMVHLPMEPSDPKWDLGPGGMFLSASDEDLAKITRENIAAIPYAIGANNHMGSKFTRNSHAMRIVLAELKEQELFFVDSVTTGSSIAMAEAEKMGIKTNRRHTFLDNVQDRNKVCEQVKKLIALSHKQGYGIGIGHPFQATMDGLSDCKDKLLQSVDLVPIHELVQ